MTNISYISLAIDKMSKNFEYGEQKYNIPCKYSCSSLEDIILLVYNKISTLFRRRDKHKNSHLLISHKAKNRTLVGGSAAGSGNNKWYVAPPPNFQTSPGSAISDDGRGVYL